MNTSKINRQGAAPLTIIRGPIAGMVDLQRVHELVEARVSPYTAEIQWRDLVVLAGGYWRGGSSLILPEAEPGGGREYHGAMLDAAPEYFGGGR
jgi:hypothetical protein